MKTLITPLLILSVILMACKKESFITSPDALVRITADTLKYDTVFASAGSVTQSFKIINENNRKLLLSSVQLMGLNNSSYQINIDGQASSSVSNIEIDANDSIYVFVQVNIDPSSGALPFIVRDSIQVAYNGKERWVQLEAWGQNAHFLRAYEVTSNETWTNDLPYVILDYLYVAENNILTIDEGCRIFMHADAPIIVDGSLLVNGQSDSINRVYFQGDRLDDPYRNYPAAWPGIYFRSPSSGNQFNYAVIKNAYQALVTEGIPAGPDAKLRLNACIIDNAYDAGIWSRNSSIEAVNCLISNCGRNLLIEGGGQHSITHCTLVTYSNSYINHKDPVLIVTDNLEGTAYPLTAVFVNNIIWGEGGLVENEVLVNKTGNVTFDVTFNHNLWKVTNTPANSSSTGIINNQAPLFDSIAINERFFNFRLRDDSPARQAGTNAGVLLDLDGNPRVSLTPDLGAYERQ